MPKVTLIEFTGKGRQDETRHAANLLAFTKATRLDLTAGLFERIQGMTDAELDDQLDYMSKTIRSSWEFVDVTFLVENVTRACAQQMTRTRTASFAMQSLRVVDATELPVANPFTPADLFFDSYEETVAKTMQGYQDLMAMGSAPQDARGLLPLNTETNLIVKYNLRSFVDLVTARKSHRTQSEYRDIVLAMEAAVLRVWPWSEPFFVDSNDSAIKILEGVIDELGLEVGGGPGWDVAKAIDLIRGTK